MLYLQKNQVRRTFSNGPDKGYSTGSLNRVINKKEKWE